MLPEDHNEPIPSETPLYRRINPAVHLVWDDNFKCRRISTGAFRAFDLSVALGDTLEFLGRDPASLLEDYSEQCLVSFGALIATEAGLDVVRDPTPDEPAHGEVRGKKRKPVMKALASACVWIVPPENGCEPPYPEGAPG